MEHFCPKLFALCNILTLIADSVNKNNQMKHLIIIVSKASLKWVVETLINNHSVKNNTNSFHEIFKLFLASITVWRYLLCWGGNTVAIDKNSNNCVFDTGRSCALWIQLCQIVKGPIICFVVSVLCLFHKFNWYKTT